MLRGGPRWTTKQSAYRVMTVTPHTVDDAADPWIMTVLMARH
jgi:hypothetical protein